MIIKITVLLCLITTLQGFSDGDALYEKGAAAFKSNPTQALEFFEQAGEVGNVSAMVGAGHCYETGTGTEVDFTKAITFYEQAVRLNSIKACEGLARIYASCPEPEFHDGEKAIRFASAVVRKQPRGESLRLLACAYARGWEFDKAVSVMKKALLKMKLNEIEEGQGVLEGFKKGVPYPQHSADQWITMAAVRGSVWAMMQLVTEDIEAGRIDLAKQRLMKGAVGGFPKAYYELGLLYQTENPDQAIEYLKKAVQAGVSGSSRKIVEIYLTLEKYEYAKRWVEKGIESDPEDPYLSCIRRFTLNYSEESSAELLRRGKYQLEDSWEEGKFGCGDQCWSLYKCRGDHSNGRYRNSHRAIVFFSLAGAMGNSKGYELVATIFLYGESDGSWKVPINMEEAEYWFDRARQSNSRSKCATAFFKLQTSGGSPDYIRQELREYIHEYTAALKATPYLDSHS